MSPIFTRCSQLNCVLVGDKIRLLLYYRNRTRSTLN